MGYKSLMVKLLQAVPSLKTRKTVLLNPKGYPSLPEKETSKTRKTVLLNPKGYPSKPERPILCWLWFSKIAHIKDVRDKHPSKPEYLDRPSKPES